MMIGHDCKETPITGSPNAMRTGEIHDYKPVATASQASGQASNAGHIDRFSAAAVSATVATVGDVTTYLTRKHCPCCNRRAERATEVKRTDDLTYGYYLCPRGHSWEMKWKEP